MSRGISTTQAMAFSLYVTFPQGMGFPHNELWKVHGCGHPYRYPGRNPCHYDYMGMQLVQLSSLYNAMQDKDKIKQPVANYMHTVRADLQS